MGGSFRRPESAFQRDLCGSACGESVLCPSETDQHPGARRAHAVKLDQNILAIPAFPSLGNTCGFGRHVLRWYFSAWQALVFQESNETGSDPFGKSIAVIERSGKISEPIAVRIVLTLWCVALFMHWALYECWLEWSRYYFRALQYRSCCKLVDLRIKSYLAELSCFAFATWLQVVKTLHVRWSEFNRSSVEGEEST